MFLKLLCSTYKVTKLQFLQFLNPIYGHKLLLQSVKVQTSSYPPQDLVMHPDPKRQGIPIPFMVVEIYIMKN